MDMVSLKRPKPSPKEVTASPSSPYDEYPYGTRLNLDPDSVKALDLEDCDVGEVVMIHAEGKITSKRDENGKVSMDIQLTDAVVKGSKDGEYEAGFSDKDKGETEEEE